MIRRHLLALYSGVIRYTRSIKQTSPLLNLPLDVILLIFDELPLHATILLSQTCTHFRSLLRSKYSLAIKKISDSERLELLVVLGNLLPHHWTCTQCRSLHQANQNDVPYYQTNYYRPCPWPESLWSCHRVNQFYIIAYRHVQLATKYTREGMHHRHRAKILRKYAVRYPEYFSARLDFTAEPVIIDGRFILRTTYEFHELVKPLSLEIISEAFFGFCPHLHAVSLSGQLDQAISLAFQAADAGSSRSYAANHSCERCPTDYSITVLLGRHVTFDVFQDLGSGFSSTDPYWRSHILGDINSQPGGWTKFDYEHGSVRELYLSWQRSVLAERKHKW